MGIKCSNTVEVYFDNTPIPAENLIGGVCDGFKAMDSKAENYNLEAAIGKIFGSEKAWLTVSGTLSTSYFELKLWKSRSPDFGAPNFRKIPISKFSCRKISITKRPPTISDLASDSAYLGSQFISEFFVKVL